MKEKLFICDGVGIHCGHSCTAQEPHKHGTRDNYTLCNEQRDCRKAGKLTTCVPYHEYKIELPKELFKI